MASRNEGLLQAMDIGDFMSSFEDMQRALEQFGFRALGFAASYEQLTKLKMPVIVKQDLDYSCGSASLATLLNEHYGQSLTEQKTSAKLDAKVI